MLGKTLKNKRDELARQKYLKLRNKVVKLKKSSIQKYFENLLRSLCVKIFYKTVKPFLPDKGTGSNASNIILLASDALITDPFHVAHILNA